MATKIVATWRVENCVVEELRYSWCDVDSLVHSLTYTCWTSILINHSLQTSCQFGEYREKSHSSGMQKVWQEQSPHSFALTLTFICRSPLEMEATTLICQISLKHQTETEDVSCHAFLTNLSNFSLWVILPSLPNVEIRVYLQMVYTWISIDWGEHSVTSVSINVTSIVNQSCWYWSSGVYLPNVSCLCQAKSQLYHRGLVGKGSGLQRDDALIRRWFLSKFVLHHLLVV